MDGTNETNDGLGIHSSSPWYDASKTINRMDDKGNKSKKKKKGSSLMTGQLTTSNNNKEDARLGITAASSSGRRSPSNNPVATIHLWNEMESRIHSWDEMETKETNSNEMVETVDFDEVSDYDNYENHQRRGRTSARRSNEDREDRVITGATTNNGSSTSDIQDVATKGTNDTGSSSNGISTGSDSSSIDSATVGRRRKKLFCYLLILILFLGGAAILAFLAGQAVSNKKDDSTNANTLNNNDDSNELDVEEETNLGDEEEIKLTDPPQPQPTEEVVSNPTDAPVTLTSSPTSPSPTNKPSLAPTNSHPSPAPSANPTSQPSETPSSAPSNTPPTGTPTTSAPTVFHVDPNPVPPNPPPGYFNYDLNDTLYGPNAWHLVDTSQHWLIEFTQNGFGSYRGHLDEKEPLVNRCSGSSNAQSPINLVSNVARCDATHEIRSWCGSRGLYYEEYQRLILPHKLSLVLSRRNCVGSGSGCSTGRPPILDYPRYSANTRQQFSDLLNLDIKIPAEHSVENVTYDAEIQLFHTHLDPDPARASSLGLPIRATADGHNAEFQELLSVFQSTYDSHNQRCLRKQRQLRQRSNPRKEELKEVNGDKHYSTSERQRDLQDAVPQEMKFNPYSDAFMPGHFFFRYEGSMTEPPCMDITWFVMMEPMLISLDQLEQMKMLLFTHVDENCEKTSVHNGDLSVSRPRFPVGDVEVQRCGPGTFLSDIEMGGDPSNKCSP